MADVKWTELPTGTPTGTDLIPYVEDPGGTPVNKTTTVDDLPGGGGGDGNPHVDINPIMGSVSHINWNTLSGADATSWGTRYSQSSGAQHAQRVWNVLLASGTWTVEVLYAPSTNRGIITVYIAGASVGTIDQYAAAPAVNTLGSVTGISVASTGIKELKFVMATKNGSSSSYYGILQWIQLRKTA